MSGVMWAVCMYVAHRGIVGYRWVLRLKGAGRQDAAPRGMISVLRKRVGLNWGPGRSPGEIFKMRF